MFKKLSIKKKSTCFSWCSLGLIVFFSSWAPSVHSPSSKKWKKFLEKAECFSRRTEGRNFFRGYKKPTDFQQEESLLDLITRFYHRPDLLEKKSFLEDLHTPLTQEQKEEELTLSIAKDDEGFSVLYLDDYHLRGMMGKKILPKLFIAQHIFLRFLDLLWKNDHLLTFISLGIRKDNFDNFAGNILKQALCKTFTTEERNFFLSYIFEQDNHFNLRTTIYDFLSHKKNYNTNWFLINKTPSFLCSICNDVDIDHFTSSKNDSLKFFKDPAYKDFPIKINHRLSRKKEDKEDECSYYCSQEESRQNIFFLIEDFFNTILYASPYKEKKGCFFRREDYYYRSRYSDEYGDELSSREKFLLAPCFSLTEEKFYAQGDTYREYLMAFVALLADIPSKTYSTFKLHTLCLQNEFYWLGHENIKLYFSIYGGLNKELGGFNKDFEIFLKEKNFNIYGKRSPDSSDFILKSLPNLQRIKNFRRKHRQRLDSGEVDFKYYGKEFYGKNLQKFNDTIKHCGFFQDYISFLEEESCIRFGKRGYNSCQCFNISSNNDDDDDYGFFLPPNPSCYCDFTTLNKEVFNVFWNIMQDRTDYQYTEEDKNFCYDKIYYDLSQDFLFLNKLKETFKIFDIIHYFFRQNKFQQKPSLQEVFHSQFLMSIVLEYVTEASPYFLNFSPIFFTLNVKEKKEAIEKTVFDKNFSEVFFHCFFSKKEDCCSLLEEFLFHEENNNITAIIKDRRMNLLYKTPMFFRKALKAYYLR